MKRTIRSFGRTKGHKLSDNQEKVLKEFLPKIRPTIEVMSSDNIWFEIGFGAGEHLIQLIDERKDDRQVIIGCEPYINGAVKAVKYIADNNIENVFIFDGDAKEIINEIKSIERCYILFPDPWPKKRHHKRRIIQREFIEKILEKVIGSIVIATDHHGYSEWIIEELNGLKYQYMQFENSEECAEAGILTRYCRKALETHDKINFFKINQKDNLWKST
jgi:tRNA (guanine-N7-)-methyltransferase